jgi:hypothetical protein
MDYEIIDIIDSLDITTLWLGLVLPLASDVQRRKPNFNSGTHAN